MNCLWEFNLQSAILNLQSAFILTLDIGTSSLRAMLFDSNARAVDGMEAQIKYEMRTTPDGGEQAGADEMLGNANRAMDQLLALAGEDAHIAAVASDSLAASVLGVDANRRAVTPVFTYADSRGAAEVAELRQRFDEKTVHQRVGTPFHTSYLPARFLWLAHTFPDEFARARYWMSLDEYFMFQWLGQRACSYSMASWTGLLNRQKLEWDAGLLAALPVSVEQLAPLVDHDTALRGLRPEFAARWPALQNAVWFPAVGDGAAANIGSGCVDPSRIALTIGTSSAMRVVLTPHPLRPLSPLPTKCVGRGERGLGEWGEVPHDLWCYRIDKECELVGGALSEGGNLFAWMNEVLRLGDAERAEQALAAMEPDAHGLTILPFLAGERAPDWLPNAHGAILGLSLSTRPLDILRAGMEAVAFRLGLVFQSLKSVAPDARQIVASGGALTHSPVWAQIIADTLGMPVTLSAEIEATSRGDALLALQALGVVKSFNDLPAQLGATFAPDAGRHEKYARAMERQEALLLRLKG